MKMLKSLFLLFVFTLIGCSSQPKKVKTNEEIQMEEFDKIENSQFVEVSEVPYDESKDFFLGENSEYDALSNESIQRLPKPQLETLSQTGDTVGRIISLCYRGEFKDAFGLFDRSYKKYKSHPSLWNQLGSCYFLQGNYRKALIYYNKSRGISKNYAPPVNNLGVLYQAKGDDQKALSAFQKASKLNTFSRTPIFNLAQLFLKYGFIQKAEGLFVSLYKRNKRDKDVINAMATISLMKGDYSQAIRFFEALDRRIFQIPEFGLNYALALKLNGNARKAKNIVERIDEELAGKTPGYLERVRRYVEQ